jgi:molybdate transport system substrate-binding protein
MSMRALSIVLAIMAVIAVMAAVAAPGSPPAQPGPALSVAAASDLQTVLPALTADFERKTGIKPTVTFGSSGNFFAQIQNGAPFDVFFSADADYPRRLADAGRVVRASIYDYATGRLVLWTRQDSGIDVTKGLKALRETRVRRIAIANPTVAPYGRAAVAALRSDNSYTAIEGKLVFADNVAQAAQLAESGNADVALIGHGLALDARLRHSGRFADVPSRMYPPIVQSMAIVASSPREQSARSLLQYMKGVDARRTLESFGFDVPTATR